MDFLYSFDVAEVADEMLTIIVWPRALEELALTKGDRCKLSNHIYITLNLIMQSLHVLTI